MENVKKKTSPFKKAFSLKRSYFAFPYAVIGAIFVVIPLLIMLYFAFTTADGGFTFDNFISFFTKPNVWKNLFSSLGMAALTTIICLLIAYPLALMLSNSAINKSAILVMLFILPMWINSLLRTYAVKNIFQLIGFDVPYLAVLIGLVYDFFPFMLLPLYTIMVNLDKSYVEAAADLGSGPIRTFFRIRLPLSLPGIMSGILMVFMPAVSTFAIPAILGDKDIYMFGNIIYTWFEASGGGWNIGSAYSFILLVLIGVTMIIANKVSGGKASAAGQAKGGSLL